jgi:hypothetical protein
MFSLKIKITRLTVVFFTKFKLADSEIYDSFLNGKGVVLTICLT